MSLTWAIFVWGQGSGDLLYDGHKLRGLILGIANGMKGPPWLWIGIPRCLCCLLDPGKFHKAMLWFRCRSGCHGDLWKCDVEGTVVKLFQQDWGLRGLTWCNRELHLGGHQNCCWQLWISWDVDRLFDHKPYIWGSDGVVGAVFGKVPASCWTLPKQPPCSDGVLRVHHHCCWTLSKQSPCFDVCVHANKAISHKEIELKTTACKTRMCNEQFNKCLPVRNNDFLLAL